MIKAGSVLSVAGLLLVGSALMAVPAAADGEGSGGNGGAGSYGQVPPPPPDWMKPAPIGPPGLAGDAPWDGVTPLKYPTPRPAAPAPVYNAPAPVYKAPAAPAPAYKVPQPVYVPPAAPAIIAPAVPAPRVVDAPAAPESVEDALTPAATPSEAPTSSVSPTAAPSGEPTAVPAGDVERLDAQAASSQDDATPVIVTASVVAVGVAGGFVFLQFGPGIEGIRGMARVLLRR
jgi:hypothetical protein